MTPARTRASGARTDPDQVAAGLRVGIGLLVRRLRQVKSAGELTIPENSALARLDRGGPATSAALAKIEQISPQSMGATLAALEARGLVERHPDPGDGRKVVLSLTDPGRLALEHRRSVGDDALARALADGFTPSEVRQLQEAVPLIERLAGMV
jgi:DNA-binding MarR family transcriptional regulator